MTDREIEIRIVARLVATILASGLMISVWEGEDWAIKCSTDAAAIVAAMRSTDMDTLILRTHQGAHGKVGSILLVYGNGIDVVSDYTDNHQIENIVDEALREWS